MDMETSGSAGVIARVEQITPSWLNAALGGRFLAENDFVVSCEAIQIAIGEGFAGRLYRLFLTFEKASPSTLIVKLATENAAIKSATTDENFYREARFYRQVAPQVSIDIPQVYYSAYDNNELVIVMQDLGNIELGSSGLEATVAETEAAFSAIARFHTQWWNHEITKERWLAPAGDDLDREELAQMLEVSLEKYGDQYPYLAECVKTFLNYLPKMPKITAKRPPLTLIHGDFHRKNVHFREDGSPVIFDWQIVETNAPVTDIANWLLMYLTTENRRAHEFDLLRHYHSSLGKACRTRYSFRRLKADYRQAMIPAMMRLHLVLEMVDLDIAGGKKVAPLFLKRIEQASEDHQILKMIRSMWVLIWLGRLQNLFAWK